MRNKMTFFLKKYFMHELQLCLLLLYFYFISLVMMCHHLIYIPLPALQPSLMAKVGPKQKERKREQAWHASLFLSLSLPAFLYSYYHLPSRWRTRRNGIKRLIKHATWSPFLLPSTLNYRISHAGESAARHLFMHRNSDEMAKTA